MPYTVPKLTDFGAAALDEAAAELLSALMHESAAVANEADHKVFRDRWMARKNGGLTLLSDQWLKAAPKDAKREVGQRVNELKSKVEQPVDETLTQLKGGASDSRLGADRVDTNL